jgi:tryptophan-rich sensory protein
MSLLEKEVQIPMASLINNTQNTLRNATKDQARWRWYHGVVFYVLAQLLTFGLSAIVNVATGQEMKSLRDTFGDVSYFRNLRQAKITPPSWVFGPAWTINNISTIWGNLRVLDKPDGTPGKNTFLALQGASWLNYIVFNAAYFSLRSPINAFALTLSMFILTILSQIVALFQLKDSKVAFSLATLTIWLLIALTAASFQVAWNHDDLYHAGPFVEPVPSLEKQVV